MLMGWLQFFLSKPVKAGQFDFGLTTSLSERYDDNIDLEEKDFEEEDFITSSIPNLSLSYLSTTTNFALMYNPALEVYAQHSEENEVRQNGNLSLTSQLTPRLNLTVTDVLSLTPGQDIAREEEFTERRRWSRSLASDRLSNDFASTLSYQILKATFLRGGFSYRFDDYDKSEEVDSDEYGFHFGIDHQLTGADTLFSNYRYRILRYDQGSLQSEINDTDVQSISIGDTHRFPRELVLTISGGISLIDEDTEGRETNWNGQVILSKDFRTGSLEASFDRDVSPGSGFGGTTVHNTFNVTARKEFTRHLSGSLSTYFSTEESTSGDQLDTEDWGWILGSMYQFSRKLTGTLTCSFIRQNSQGQTRVQPGLGDREEGDTDNYRGRVGVDYFLRPHWSVFSSYSYYQQNALDPTARDVENNLLEVGTRITWF